MSSSRIARPQLSQDELRSLYEKSFWKPAIYVLLVYSSAAAGLAAAAHFHSVFVYAVVFLTIGALQHQLSIIQHEANHFILFRPRALNELVGSVSAYLVGFTMRYRGVHLEHHRLLGKESDPDLPNYEEYPLSRAAFARRIFATVTGIAAIAQFLKLSQRGSSDSSAGLPAPSSEMTRLILTQLALLAIFILFGHPWLYFLLWILPLVTVAKSLTYLRNVVEHTKTREIDDPELARYRTISTNLFEGFFFSPMNFNYHAEHHFYPGIPYYNLPRLHKILRTKPGYSDSVEIFSGYLRFLLTQCVKGDAPLN